MAPPCMPQITESGKAGGFLDLTGGPASRPASACPGPACFFFGLRTFFWAFSSST
ncbi:MAG: hypothetical protein MZV64_00115 [Ignavibacteriales bacterium]|nr:hypothetical protein [Ignavibacteriales bacterium]